MRIPSGSSLGFIISPENDKCLVFFWIARLQTKTGIYLLQDGNEEPFNIRLHLSKDILTIQEQDVVCVSGEPFYSSVGSVENFFFADLSFKEIELIFRIFL